MEVRWLKTLLCVLLSVCSSLRAHPIDQNHENVINLLEALNMSRPLKGVSKVQGEWPGTQAYKLRPRSPHLTLPEQYSHYLVSSLRGSLGIHLMGRQGADSSGTLLSFSSSSSSSPLLQLYSSTRSKSLRLDHQAGSEGQGLASVLFPGGSPFSGGGWVRLALALEAGRVSLFVDCRDAVVIQRDKEERVKLQLPPDLVITLASTKGDMESKFTGYVQTAEISTRAYQRRPWHCDNITDSLHGPPHAQLNNSAPVDRVDSGPGLEPQQDIANYQPHNPSLHPHHPQGDQPQRGGVLLGPPAPHGVKPVSQSQGEDRLRGLEERLEGLERMLDMIKAQNVDLQARVQYLEGCECVRRGCVWEGRQVDEGHRWETHRNTFCSCTSGQVTCSAPTDGVWDGFTKLRAEFSPQAGGHTYFLPWQRYFLRVVEQELQAVSSCQLGVPYFEWTVDSGDLLTSAVWQAEIFGGDGEREGNGERERDEERDRASEGDGEQESNSVSGCVPHHSFQGLSARFHWSPCLRRSFNTSVSVPDAVSVQRLLSQGNFLSFSQALQGLSGLFRLWVGGHMASPLAAYDPLYLSHAAFIDKLWTHWQDRHRDVHTHEEAHGHTHLHTQYPVRQRHVKMKPFGIAPDDVMSSREQLCVVYVPITLGAPCNVTSSLLAERGKGRHRGAKDTASYHRKRQDTQNNHKHSTYDYNAQGYDGFDHSGYNRNGYDRQGFNRMGWDRLGYNRDGLDRDHIDKEGYDISGYNRYGFDRHNVTWFGMRWDGLFMREEEREEETQGEKEKESEVREESGEEEEREREKVMSELFSDSGYSVYGFDPFGLDRGGFDAFGFRPDGYDKDSCNWFYNGPHYLRFYYHTQQQLISTNQHTLNHITRTCSPITALPQHWPLQDWMALDQEESQALIGQLEREWAGQKHSDNYYTHKVMSQRGRDIWLPITPDSRFCFELHWFSGCPLGSAPLTCPDLCREARCLGNPMAECRLRNCGSCFTEWLDPTTGAYVICQGW